MSQRRTRTDETTTGIRAPTLGYSLLTLAVTTAIIVTGIVFLGADLQIMMFLAFMAVIPLALRLGFRFIEVESFAYDMIHRILQPMILILTVGVLIGSWIASGTVPTLIYYGMQIIDPQFFLVSTMVLCIVASVSTGTSWGTIGTVGIAMMGIGSGLGMNPGMTAGAIVCGAYFGDKMSPLSDSTNMAPALSGGELIPHIRHMLWTTGPATLISLVIFLVLGFRGDNGSGRTGDVNEISSAIAEIFAVGWVPVIPILAVLVLLIFRMPAYPAVFIGSIVGAFVAVTYQGLSVSDTLAAMYSGYTIDSGDALIDDLFNRGGMTSMFGIAVLFIFALGLGGILNGTGILARILESFSSRIKSTRGLIFATVAVSYVSNMVGATISFALIMTATLMKPLYKKSKVRPENLSRVIEDVGTMGGPIIPWNTGAVYVAGTLGISPLEFIPYCFLSFFCLLFTLLYGVTGWTIKKHSDDDIPPGYLEPTAETR